MAQFKPERSLVINDVMQTFWSPTILDALILSMLLLLGHFIKRKVPFFNRFLLPSAILAGLMGLILGPELLGIIPLDLDRLGMYVYHLLALGFISLSLKDRPMTPSRPVIKTALFIISIYLIQAVLGMGISWIASETFDKTIFPGLGLLLALGFGQGPGQAYSVGKGWEASGIEYAGVLGLTIATIGFLWATFGGVIWANVLKKKYPPVALLKEEATAEAGFSPSELFGEAETEEEERGEITLSNMIDVGTRQLFLIGIIYLAVYLTLRGITQALLPLGNMGANLSNALWGFHFVFGTIYAIFLKFLMARFKKIGLMKHQYNNNRLLSRISGTSFDFMVTASIAAISLDVVLKNWLLLLIITVSGGLVTLWFSLFAAKRVFKTEILEHTLVLFGTYTGTLSTGMALLRTVDPAFKTKVADQVVLGGGLALFLAFPLLLLLNLPVIGFVEGQSSYYAITLISLAAYGALSLFFLFFRTGSKT